MGARIDFPAAQSTADWVLAGEALHAIAAGRDALVDRLWRLRFSRSGAELMESLSRLGDPVRYWYSEAPWDLDYQTIYAREPGSMVMPSAGRAFSWKVMLDLRRKGIDTAFLIYL